MIDIITGLPNRISHLREDVIIDGSLTLKDGTQSEGYVLTSDANGLATWQFNSSASTCTITGATYSAGTLTLTNCTGGTEVSVTGFTTGSTGGLSEYAMFYGLTSGTGNDGSSDYAATIAVKTSAGTGRVPFPKTGPVLGSMVISSGITTSGLTSEVNIPTAGTYEVTFRVHTTEPGQLQLEVNGTALAETTAGNANPTSGGHPIVGVSIITVTANAKLSVINPAGNTPALTITPADGASTNAQSQTLTIKRLS